MDVELDGLTVAFPGRPFPAVHEVTLRIRHADRVALIGPSGAGKSTLLRAILGAVPASGTVRVGGLNPYGGARERRTIRGRTGFLRQGGDLVPGLSARLNAVLGTSGEWRARDWLHALRGGVPTRYEDRLSALAARHGVADVLEPRVEDLSGGQRQRVALVRALLPRPALLLADEPTAGLDPVTARAAVDGLLTASDATIVLATHDVGVAARFDRVVALRDGRVVHDGAAPDGDWLSRFYGPVPA
jgi:ABC-type phosphate/phosphonate transport system ATPase subunit